MRGNYFERWKFDWKSIKLHFWKNNDARNSIQTQIKYVPFIVHPRITIFWNDNDRINSLQKNNYIPIWHSLWFHKLYKIKTIISQCEIMKLKVYCHIWLTVKYMIAGECGIKRLKKIMKMKRLTWRKLKTINRTLLFLMSNFNHFIRI